MFEILDLLHYVLGKEFGPAHDIIRDYNTKFW